MSNPPSRARSYSDSEPASGRQRDEDESYRNDDYDDDAASNNSSLPEDPLEGRPIRIRRPPENQEDMQSHDDAEDQEDAEGQDDMDDVDDVDDVGDEGGEYDEDELSDVSSPSSPDLVYGLPQNTPPPICDERATYGGAAVNPTCHQGHIWCHGAIGQCSHASHGAVPFDVCGRCSLDIQANHPVNITARAMGQPHVSAFEHLNPRDNWDSSVSIRPNNPSAFLTRLCFTCERHEMEVERQRMNDNGSTRPLNTCRCRDDFERFGNPDTVCYPHYRARWIDCLRARNRGDNWLRFTKSVLTRNGWRTYRASKGTLTWRARKGTWRACRCGSEITESPSIDPEILMCMACEGLQFEATPSANVPLFGTYDTSRYHDSRRGRVGVFNRPTALFRPRDNAIAR